MNFFTKLLKTTNLSKEEFDLLTKEVTLDDIEDPSNFQNIHKYF